jgi:DNA-binding NtrC family response regulator
MGSVCHLLTRIKGSSLTVPPAEWGLGEERGMMASTYKPFSILITDDDRGCRETLRDIVEDEGYRAFLALMDMQMPTLSGLETLQLVRQFNDLLPCILVSADASAELMRQAFSVRVYTVIPKPFSRHVILYNVVRALAKVYGQSLADDESA